MEASLSSVIDTPVVLGYAFRCPLPFPTLASALGGSSERSAFRPDPTTLEED